MSTSPERGIIVTTAELASEETGAVLDAIATTGANAITTTSNIVVPSDTPTDYREPSIDVQGERRTLDRPVWGRTMTWVNRYVAYQPDPELWRDLPWPPPPAAPEEIRVDHARAAIDGAHARGMRVYAHFAAYALPGGADHREGQPTNDELRVRYRPTRLIGGIHPEGISWVGCINNPTVRAYGRVRLIELLRHYGDVDGLALDWVDFPTFFLEKLFTCFCDHCHAQAISLGYDWEQITGAVRVLWDSLHTLTARQAEALARSGDWGDLVVDPDAMLPGFDAWLDFKAESVALAIADLRGVMTEEGAGHLLVSTVEPALPWGRISGAAFARAGRGVDRQYINLFSAHWLMMVRWWSESILAWNRGSDITPELAIRGMMALFGITLEHPVTDLSPATFGMPARDVPHNLTPASYTDRLENALALQPNQAPVLPLVHAYRPVDDFARQLETVRPYAMNGLWIRRFGYLCDRKLDLLHQEWSRPPDTRPLQPAPAAGSGH
jgi:hypothetical protein